jgi:hypothetical protein
MNLEDVKEHDLLVLEVGRNEPRLVRVEKINKATFAVSGFGILFNKRTGRAWGDGSEVWSTSDVRRPRPGEVEEIQRATEVRKARRMLAEIAKNSSDDDVVAAAILLRSKGRSNQLESLREGM